MVYHLKHAETVRDIIATSPRFIGTIVEDAMKDIAVNPRMDSSDISRELDSCGRALSDEGLEMCLLVAREDLAYEFSGGGHNKKFEEFMEALDKRVEKHKRNYYHDHVL